MGACLSAGLAYDFFRFLRRPLLDTFDSLYQPPVNPGERFGVKFEFDPNRQSTLVLPVRS
ncbi:hypothetical protein [Burkholderia pseudomallei]|uniref:hypothetical protein n=1 Tax=Burkholderia pseudomallei TaxID=28450 RepID=UPI000DC5BB09|nr:hypothetical protein [Burkholderia pseudomallei]RAQ81782.1 hypothetical protein A4G85_31850 [Burkholderia pseudomallei]RAQ85933.1 hypothetical protein A4G85_00625 [Burkholderia pseudomallei]